MWRSRLVNSGIGFVFRSRLAYRSSLKKLFGIGASTGFAFGQAGGSCHHFSTGFAFGQAGGSCHHFSTGFAFGQAGGNCRHFSTGFAFGQAGGSCHHLKFHTWNRMPRWDAESGADSG